MRQAATALELVPGRASSWLPLSLPLHLTRFIGRGREVQHVRDLLGAHRLVTLTGAGGSGKTRLAAETVRGLEWRDVGEWAWAELASLKDPAMVAQQVMAALGFREELGHGPSRTLVEIIRDRPVLLVLDNCEHLVDACAALAEELLRACPAFRILATSREALGVPGERPVVVPPLTIPADPGRATAASVADSEAGALFVERAQAIAPSFHLTDANAVAVAQICHRLDGLPLAIELAAARIKVLGPEQIAERLDDSFHLLTSGGRTTIPRHKTLWAAIDWSYELLSERERLLLRRLSVFAGGFTLEAVGTICLGGGVEQHHVLDTLTALVDKSLVVAESSGSETRYGLLETVRQFALQQLRALREDQLLRDRHAAYFLNLIRAAEEPMFGGASDPVWLARLEAERANLLAAADWCEQQPDRAADALWLATALHWFWFAKGRFREARMRLAAALRVGGSVEPVVRARALTALGHVAIWQGDDRAAQAAFEESVALLRGADDAQWMSYSLAGLGAANIREGRCANAHPVLEEAVSLARTIETKVSLPFALYWQGIAAEQDGDSARAKAAFQEATRVAKARGHKPSIGHTFYALGRVARTEGDRVGALEHLVESLAALHETDDRWGMVNAIEELARLLAGDRRPAVVVSLLAAAEALREEMGVAVPVAVRDERERLIASTRETLGESAFAEGWSTGRALSVDELLGLLNARPVVRPFGTVEEGHANTVDTNAELQVLALGGLQVVRGGVPLGPHVWRSARARELLVFLLCHPRGCTRDQIGLAFWPDASAAQVRDNVNVTLHRLRRALGRADWVVLSQERYRLANIERCEFDVAVFERETAVGQRELRSGAGPTRLETALTLYRGDFLDGEGAADWHLDHRERLQRLYVDGLLAISDWHLTQQHFAEAAEGYRRIIGLDALHEAAYRGLMTCHAGLGERTVALRLYHRLSESLRAELGCEPDPATNALATTLNAGALAQSSQERRLRRTSSPCPSAAGKRLSNPTPPTFSGQ